MTVEEFIGTLESSDRLRIIEGKAEVYVGYLAAFKPFADHEINDISVTLCWDNLEALCQDCHNKEHHKQERHKRYRFDENGGILPPYQKNN